jgi:isopenicillin-N epimerase
LVLTTNVSAAINLVAAGLTIASPGEILLSDHEYGAMHWCWERAAQRQGLTIRTFPLPRYPDDPQEIVAAAAKAMTARTRLLFFSHVLSPLGMVLPAKELCALARSRGIISVIDGAHAPAMIDLNITDVGADFYTGNCHKWLLAATGSGFLVVGPGQEDRLQPLHVSWGYRADQYPLGEGNSQAINRDAPDAFGSTARTRFLEFEGTRDICPWLAIPEAIDFQTQIGWSAIRQQMHTLSQYARERLQGITVREATPRHPQMHGALTAFEVPLVGPKQANALRQAIWRHRIEIPVIERPDRTLIRVSGHFYNTFAEIDALATILPDAIHQARNVG